MKNISSLPVYLSLVVSSLAQPACSPKVTEVRDETNQAATAVVTLDELQPLNADEPKPKLNPALNLELPSADPAKKTPNLGPTSTADESDIDAQYERELKKANSLLKIKAHREEKHGHFWDASMDFMMAGDKVNADRMMKKHIEQRVRMFLEQGDLDMAVKTYREAGAPESADNLLRQEAKKAAKKGNFRKASDLYKNAGDNTKATEMLEKAIQQEKRQ